MLSVLCIFIVDLELADVLINFGNVVFKFLDENIELPNVYWVALSNDCHQNVIADLNFFYKVLFIRDSYLEFAAVT